MSALGAIFVGGASRRMGGFPKGRLVAPTGETILARLAGLFASLDLPCVLVGDASAYGDSGLPALADAVRDSGPLGGLVAALERAEVVIAVACDMPLVPRQVLARLTEAGGGAAVVAPIVDGVPQPLCARYESSRVLPVARERLARGRLSLRGVLDELGYDPLAITADEAAALVDWDEPGDTGAAG